MKKKQNQKEKKNSFYQKHRKSLGELGWALAAFIISFPLLNINRFSFFSWPLFILGILILLMGLRDFFKELN